jgi:hypothetical protein
VLDYILYSIFNYIFILGNKGNNVAPVFFLILDVQFDRIYLIQRMYDRWLRYSSLKNGGCIDVRCSYVLSKI